MAFMERAYFKGEIVRQITMQYLNRKVRASLSMPGHLENRRVKAAYFYVLAAWWNSGESERKGADTSS